MKYCMMCGMELTKERTIYHHKDRPGKTLHWSNNKSFCDQMCRSYFMKRVSADERGEKLDE